MNILREYNGYALVESDNTENESLIFYLDDGNDVSEYFDCFGATDLLKLSDSDFENYCIDVFRPSFKLVRK